MVTLRVVSVIVRDAEGRHSGNIFAEPGTMKRSFPRQRRLGGGERKRRVFEAGKVVHVRTKGSPRRAARAQVGTGKQK